MVSETVPKDLFHYTTREAALEYILPTERIRVGLLGKTNDPREVKEWVFSLTMPEWSAKFSRELVHLISEKANRIRNHEWKVLCMTRHHPDLKPYRPNAPELSSFLYGHSRARMWAQYAGNHTGVCLIFDGPALDRAIRAELKPNCIILSGVLRYQDELGTLFIFEELFERLYPNLSSVGQGKVEDHLRDHITDKYETFFLSKAKDWETEWEYRWLVHSEDLDPKYVPIKGAIRGVLVGMDFPPVYEPSLKQLCEKLGIFAGRVHWINGEPHATFDSIFRPAPTPDFEIKPDYTYQEAADIWNDRISTVEHFVSCGKVRGIDNDGPRIPYDEVLRVWEKRQPVYIPAAD